MAAKIKIGSQDVPKLHFMEFSIHCATSFRKFVIRYPLVIKHGNKKWTIGFPDKTSIQFGDFQPAMFDETGGSLYICPKSQAWSLGGFPMVPPGFPDTAIANVAHHRTVVLQGIEGGGFHRTTPGHLGFSAGREGVLLEGPGK